MATQAEVAEQIGVTSKTIQNWSKQAGFPQYKGRGGYDAVKILLWQISVLEAKNKALQNGGFDEFESGNQSESKKIEKLQEYAKLEERRVRIRLTKHKLNVAEKIYAPVTLLEEFAEKLAIPLAVILSALLPKLKSVWQDMPIEATKILDVEIAKAQNELANVQLDLTEYIESDTESDQEWLESIDTSDSENGD
jgi:transcriptional regulator with XRE-family HTH domain